MLAGLALWGCLAVIAYTIDPPAPDRGVLPLSQLLLVYLGVGFGSGSIYGLFKPYANSFPAEALLGAFAALPYSFLMVLASEHWRFTHLDTFDRWAIVVIAAFVGPLVIALRHAKSGNDETRSRDA